MRPLAPGSRWPAIQWLMSMLVVKASGAPMMVSPAAPRGQAASLLRCCRGVTITHMATDPRLRPLGDAERDELEALLEALPPPLDPLDLSALDGFLVGVLLQPQVV